LNALAVLALEKQTWIVALKKLTVAKERDQTPPSKTGSVLQARAAVMRLDV